MINTILIMILAAKLGLLNGWVLGLCIVNLIIWVLRLIVACLKAGSEL